MSCQSLYTIHYPRFWLIEDRPKEKYDRDNLLFHIKENDYFGTLATVLSLMKERLNDKKFSKWRTETLKKETDNLMYLQRSHKIVPKNDQSDSQT